MRVEMLADVGGDAVVGRQQVLAHHDRRSALAPPARAAAAVCRTSHFSLCLVSLQRSDRLRTCHRPLSRSRSAIAIARRVEAAG